MEEWLTVSHAVAAAGGALIGLVAGFFLFRKSVPAPVTTGSSDQAPRVLRPKLPESNVVTKETFTAYISRVDVERGMTIPLAHHLSDVVEESNECGTFGHQLKLVFLGFDKGPPPEQDAALLKHLTLVHQQSPHLAFWLNDETLERYLKLLHLALMTESKESKYLSWHSLLDDIDKRAADAIRKDLGEGAAEDTVHRLMMDGMERMRAVVARLDPEQHHVDPAIDPIPKKHGMFGKTKAAR